jgi:hypothetical protein
LELGKEVEKSHEINKARMRGGEKEVEKIDEEYDVKMSHKKAEEILGKMREKIEKAASLYNY